jgi:NADP-dependent 3-hydroxy acid dehydrogenase YdfG
MNQNILITGTTSGFGLLASNTLIKGGHTIFASMRDPEGRNKSVADELESQGAHVVDVHVTYDKSVENGVAEALQIAGHIDVIVNNAGVAVSGSQ